MLKSWVAPTPIQYPSSPSFLMLPALFMSALYTATSLNSQKTLLDTRGHGNCFWNRSPGGTPEGAFLQCDRLISIVLLPFALSLLLPPAWNVDVMPEDMEATLNHREKSHTLRLAKQVHKRSTDIPGLTACPQTPCYIIKKMSLLLLLATTCWISVTCSQTQS